MNNINAIINNQNFNILRNQFYNIPFNNNNYLNNNNQNFLNNIVISNNINSPYINRSSNLDDLLVLKRD